MSGVLSAKYRDFILYARLELPQEENTDINSDMEDDVRSHFPTALNVTIPRIDEVSNIRYIHYYYSTVPAALIILHDEKMELCTTCTTNIIYTSSSQGSKELILSILSVCGGVISAWPIISDPMMAR